MTDELKYYAEHLIREHAFDIEGLSIDEMAEGFLGHDLTDEEFSKVRGFIKSATVTVKFGDDNA